MRSDPMHATAVAREGDECRGGLSCIPLTLIAGHDAIRYFDHPLFVRWSHERGIPDNRMAVVMDHSEAMHPGIYFPRGAKSVKPSGRHLIRHDEVPQPVRCL